MLKQFYGWLDKLGGANINSSGQAAASEESSLKNNQRPYTGPDRRRSEPHGVLAGDEWESNRQIKDALLASAGRQEEDAKEKQEKSWHWGETGFIEASAVVSVRRFVESVPIELPVKDYKAKLEQGFDETIGYYRNNDDADPDGYALGTVYAILRGAGWSL